MRLRVLVAADEIAIRGSLSAILERQGQSVEEAVGVESALGALERDAFGLVVAEADGTEAHGWDLLERAKAKNPDTVVVVVTADTGATTLERALQAGAFDHLVKPVEDTPLVSAVLLRAARRAELLRDNRRLIESLKRNVEQMGKLNGVLHQLAITDALTGLHNRRFFREAVQIEVQRCRRHERAFSLLFLDIDSFKQYNDTHGHVAGDELLTAFAEQLRKVSRATTVLARYGGEEFVVLVPETDKEGARRYAERIRKLIEDHPFPGRETQPTGSVTVSVGVATFPEDGEDSSAILTCADRALYRAKEGGRNRVC